MRAGKSFIIVVLCLFFAQYVFQPSAYSEGESQETEKEGNSGVGFPCARALLPSVIQSARFVKSKGFIIDLKECKDSEMGTKCTFSVTNCSGKDAWLYLDKSSYLSDDAGGSYDLKIREFGGRTAKEGGLVRALLPSGVTEDGGVIFERVSKDAKNVNVGVVMTGGAWAGDVVKGLFRNVSMIK